MLHHLAAMRYMLPLLRANSNRRATRQFGGGPTTGHGRRFRGGAAARAARARLCRDTELTVSPPRGAMPALGRDREPITRCESLRPGRYSPF